jgi:hypothetical protein
MCFSPDGEKGGDEGTVMHLSGCSCRPERYVQKSKVVFEYPKLNGALKGRMFISRKETKIAECVALRRRKERS